MKLTIKQSEIDSAYPLFLRDAGYSLLRYRDTGKQSFIRPLGRGDYPRFHVYVDEAGDSLTFNLHLDQKKASYEGTSAHSGEYDSDTVAAEIARLRSLLRPSRIDRSPHSGQTASTGDERSRRWSDLIRNM